MKTLKTTLFTLLLVWLIACQRRANVARTQMMLESEVSCSNVTVVKPRQAVHPEESVSDLRGLNNIMRYDLEARERTPSKEASTLRWGNAPDRQNSGNKGDQSHLLGKHG